MMPHIKNGGRLSRRLSSLAVLTTLAGVLVVPAAHSAAAGTDDYPAPWRAPTAQGTVFDSWGEYNRECTSFVAWRLHSRNGFEMPFNADAYNWGPDAAGRGYTVNMVPANGAVAWWSSGHVAWIETVNGSAVTIEEYNHDSHGNYSERTIPANSVSGYIHFKDIGGGLTPSDNARIAQPSGAQYIFQRGAALPVSYSDAVRYNNEGNTFVQTNYTTVLTPPTPPFGTILRPVGSPSQYFWNGSQLLPVTDGPTSACLFNAYPQGNGTPAVVPADWLSTLSTGPAMQCSLADGTRFIQTDTGTQQYVSLRGAALTLTYGDAVAYDGEGDTALISMPAGYRQNPIHAPLVPANTVLRAAGNPAQFFWDGSQLHPVTDVSTSQCLLIAFPQNGVATAPPSWVSSRSQGPTQQCSLADGTRFVQVDTGAQQYVSVRGAALPVEYNDAIAYNGEGNTAVKSMPAGYIQNPIHAAVLPANTVLRAAGDPAQYFWDGNLLHYIPKPDTSTCLLTRYPQNGIAVVPATWKTSLTTASNQSCT
jgi:surface antigen